MQDFDFPVLGLLLSVAILVAIGSQRFRIPYSVGLVGAGILVALLVPNLAPPLTPGLIYFVLLPPLVFEAAIQIPWRPFRRELPLLLALVTLGVAAAAGVVAAGMHYGVGWSWLGAAVFGVLIAATDPVAVIAAFRELRVQPRLHLLVESESLLNDGVAAVGFAILVGLAAGESADMGQIALRLLASVGGGIGAGIVVAVPLILVAGRSEDHLVETTVTMLIAYASFLLAEHFHASGVLATMTAGLIVGGNALGAISDAGRRAVTQHWEFAAFLINSLLFLLIGGHEAAMPIAAVIAVAAVATVLSFAGRAVAVYPVMAAFAGTKLRVPWAYKHVLFWGGLRGALALALALAIPAAVPERETIIVVTFAVVACSIFVQGLTMPWLVRRLSLNAAGKDQGTNTVSTGAGNSPG